DPASQARRAWARAMARLAEVATGAESHDPTENVLQDLGTALEAARAAHAEWEAAQPHTVPAAPYVERARALLDELQDMISEVEDPEEAQQQVTLAGEKLGGIDSEWEVEAWGAEEADVAWE